MSSEESAFVSATCITDAALDYPDVLVVGAGPVGLVAAHELARRGVRVRVIDKRTTPTDESRACAVHAGSLDMLDRMGIADDLLGLGVKSLDMNMVVDGKTLMRVPFEGVDSAFPYCLVLPQAETERVLTDHVTALDITIERGVTATALTQDDDAVHVSLQRADGGTETITTPWVIGCDGGHSTIRQLMGAELEQASNRERFILGDVEAEHHLGDTHMYTFLSPHGPVVTIPMRGGRIRIMPQIPDTPGTPFNQHPTVKDLQKIIDERVGGITVTESHWLTGFEIRYGQVSAYRHGRVFLAGDAAHIHSPAGGQGMNTGMQDAFNLAWKLAAVVHGDGGQTLLDSYHAERHPVAASVIKFSGLLTRVGTLRGGGRLLRNVMMRGVGHISFVTGRIASNLAETNVGYKSSPAILHAGLKHAKVAAGQHLPYIRDRQLHEQLRTAAGASNTGHVILTVTAGTPAPAATPNGQVQVLVSGNDTPVRGYDHVIVDKNGIIAGRYGLHDGGRIVVRPDGYIGAAISLHDQTGLEDYFARIAR
jgi:2-polyprenyl-6-methoxyphenol hydroxylase-like FAD-dependent oxidoreductase